MNGVISVGSMPESTSLIAMARGVDKTGKSHLGYTMPKPLFVACLDKPPTHKIKEYIDTVNGKGIDYKMYMPVRDPSRPTNELVEENVAILQEFRTDLEEMMTYPSIMFDGSNNLWKLVRLAELGSETKVLPREYYEPNTIMDTLLAALHAAGKNVLFTVPLKDKYVDRIVSGRKESITTGEMVADTWKGLQFQVNVNVLMTQDNTPPYTFRMEILNSAINGSLRGIELADDDINWQILTDINFG